ncbi:hypothetical protein HKX48_003170 [Thoreauomyces humboldtii]|nr:hypothetical protein HKX48_003170 [Thoreauomyces humboldtii]
MSADNSNSNTRDLDLLAYSLIQQFLRQQNLTAALDALEAEAPHVFAELASNPSLGAHKPLTAVLEEHQLLTFQEHLGQLSLAVKKNDDELFKLGKGRMPVEDGKRVLEGIHYANILTARPATLPSTLFPDAEIVETTVSVLISSSTDQTIKITETDSGRTLGVLDHHKAAALAIDLCPSDPAYLLSGGMDGAHHIVDVRTGVAVQSWKDHGKYVVRAKFSPDGRWFATGSYDRNVHVYRRVEGREEAEPPKYEKVHSVQFRGAVESLCFLPPVNAEDSAGSATSTVTPTTASGPLAIYTLVVGSRDDNCLHYIDMDPSRAYPSTPYNMNANGDDWISFTAMDISPSPSGRHLAVYTDSKAGRIILFRARTSTQARNLWGVVADGFSQPRCCWDTAGRYLFATSDDRQVYVFDVTSGQVVRKLAGHSEIVRSIAWDPAGQRLVSCSFDKTIRTWETADGEVETGIQR